jgi:hypothetical protein
MPERFENDPFDPPPLAYAEEFPLLPPWLSRRLLAPDEKISWVWGPTFTPSWERYITHPALFLVALVGAAACLATGRMLVDKWLDLPIVFGLVAGAMLVGCVFVLAFANAYFTRLVVTNTHLFILQGYEVCRRWSMDDLPPSMIRYSAQGGADKKRSVDLDAVKSLFGPMSDKFAEAKTILAFGKQLEGIKAKARNNGQL